MIKRLGIALLLVVLASAHAFSQVNNSTYPASAIPITAAFSGADTSTAAATLPASPGRTTYICGFLVNGNGVTTPAVVQATVGPLIGGATFTYSYNMVAVSNTTLNVPVGHDYSPCIPASAINTAIAVTVPGGAGNTTTNIIAYGYQTLDR